MVQLFTGQTAGEFGECVDYTRAIVDRSGTFWEEGPVSLGCLLRLVKRIQFTTRVQLNCCVQHDWVVEEPNLGSDQRCKHRYTSLDLTNSFWRGGGRRSAAHPRMQYSLAHHTDCP